MSSELRQILEGKQKKEREIVRKKRTKAFSTKAKYNSKCHRDTITTDATALNLAKEIGDFSTVGTDKACFNKSNRKNKCSYYKSTTAVDRVHSRHDLYATKVNHGRNCYSYKRFSHIVRNCRMGEEIEL